MNSRLMLTSALVAVVLTIIGYVASSAINILNADSVAVGLFLGAVLSPLLVTALQNNQTDVKDVETATDVKTLYVGNLPYRANESAVRNLFAEHGTVHSVRLMKDKHTGKRRGFGFVEVEAVDADNMIASLNDSEFQQRTLKVREAKERPTPEVRTD